jgi:hypothetical protein
MGREVKRVALDFKFEMNEVWPGYLNPWYKFTAECPHCENGYSKEAKQIQNLWYGYAPFKPEDNGCKALTADHPVIYRRAEQNISQSKHCTIPFSNAREERVTEEAERLCGLFNTSLSYHLNQDDVDILIKEGRLSDLTQNGHKPTAEEVNEWSVSGFGHDSINCWIVTKNRCQRLGVSSSCSECKGSGDFWSLPEAEQKAEEWEQIEPPAGEGWQLWTTTTEGSPISAVCETPETLAQWLVDNCVSSFARITEDYETWLTFITDSGWAPTMVVQNGDIKSGVNAVSTEHEGETL